jgi:hypothetical protein
MSTTLPAGPYLTLRLPDGSLAPWYLLPFDKRGVCKAPQTRAHLIEATRGGTFTDLFLFSHGWNNDWETANGRYQDFIARYQGLRERFGLGPGPAPYRPLLVGITWPSTALVLPWEKGPAMAAGAGERDADVGAEQEALEAIADELSDWEAGRFYELVGRDRLSEEEALELARILAPLYARPSDEIPEDGNREEHRPDQLVELWKRAAVVTGEAASPGHGFAEEAAAAPGEGAPGEAAPGVAGFLPFDPRGPIRAFTVWKMKDRAGRVGAAGVGPLLVDLLRASASVRAHLVGHSYGAKVVLSALVAAAALPRKVESVLLLQPAVNGYCFAGTIPGQAAPGGYRGALDRVAQPILTTFSRHDAPLTRFFHLAVRRSSDLGEVRVAAEAPSRYAALGGFGPQGCTAQECQEVPTKVPAADEPRDRYPLGAGAPRIWALRGDAHIDGHGGIVNDATAWALYCQVEHRG